MEERKRHSLHLIAYIIVMLGFAFVGIIFYFRQITEQNIKTEREQRLQEYAASQSDYVKQMLDSQFHLLESLAKCVGESTDEMNRREAMDMIAKIMLDGGIFSEMLLADETGKSWNGSGVEGDVSQYKYFRQALTGVRAVSEPLIGDGPLHEIEIMLAVPIINGQGETIGVLGGACSAEQLTALLFDDREKEENRDYACAMLVSPSGEILLVSDESGVSLENRDFLENSRIEVSDAKKERIQTVIDQRKMHTCSVLLDEQRMYLTLCPMPYNQWMIGFLEDEERINSSYEFILDNDGRLNMIVSVMLAVCFALLLVVLVWDHRESSQEKVFLALYEERYRLAVDNFQAMVFETNEQTCEITVNEHFRQLFGTLNYEDYRQGKQIIPEDAAAYQKLLERLYQGETSVEAELRIETLEQDHTFRWCKIFLRGILDGDKRLVRVLGMLQDIDKSKQKEELLRIRAQTDVMTGLLNKGAVQELIRQKLSEKRMEIDGLLIADLDGLKEINDNLGHFQGDRAISAVADVLRSHFRSTDLVGRIGGDEFMVYLNAVKSEIFLSNITASFCRKISRIRIGKDSEYPLGISVGIALVRPEDHDFQELYEKVDKALYYVKSNEKNGYALYDAKMETEEEERKGERKLPIAQLNWNSENAIKQAMDIFCSIYQYIISINLTERVYSMVQSCSEGCVVCHENGAYDDLRSLASIVLQPEDRNLMSERFSADNLLKAFERGEQKVEFWGRRNTGEGHMYCVALLFEVAGSDDRLALFLMRAV